MGEDPRLQSAHVKYKDVEDGPQPPVEASVADVGPRKASGSASQTVKRRSSLFLEAVEAKGTRMPPRRAFALRRWPPLNFGLAPLSAEKAAIRRAKRLLEEKATAEAAVLMATKPANKSRLSSIFTVKMHKTDEYRYIWQQARGAHACSPRSPSFLVSPFTSQVASNRANSRAQAALLGGRAR